jgi:Fe-S oxidoreductase
MKIEFLHHYRARHGLSARDRLVAYMPRYAPYAAWLAPVLNLRNQVPLLAQMAQPLTGFTAKRKLPHWRKPWAEPGEASDLSKVAGDGKDVVLFADTFNRYFEPDNLAAAQRVLASASYRLHKVNPQTGQRPLCCGRTFLSAGLVDEARAEQRRLVETLAPYVAKGARIVGLEPACISTLRDELPVVLAAAEAKPIAQAAVLFEECLAQDFPSGKATLSLKANGPRVAHLHGHCHQKALGLMPAVESVLRAVPGLDVRLIQSSCCGGAGAFGYETEHVDVSLAMAELTLLPALRLAHADDLIVADGTSCRHQITDALGRVALHVARVLDLALA